MSGAPSNIATRRIMSEFAGEWRTDAARAAAVCLSRVAAVCVSNRVAALAPGTVESSSMRRAAERVGASAGRCVLPLWNARAALFCGTHTLPRPPRHRAVPRRDVLAQGANASLPCPMHCACFSLKQSNRCSTVVSRLTRCFPVALGVQRSRSRPSSRCRRLSLCSLDRRRCTHTSTATVLPPCLSVNSQDLPPLLSVPPRCVSTHRSHLLRYPLRPWGLVAGTDHSISGALSPQHVGSKQRQVETTWRC
jgi:hypothetical protein